MIIEQYPGTNFSTYDTCKGFTGHPFRFYLDSGIGELINKSLVFIKHDKIDMHRAVQEMGRWVVRQESPLDPSKRSRLWIKDEILQVLLENAGTEKIEGIKLECEASGKGRLNSKAFKKMKDLRLFVAHNAISSRTQFCFPDKLKYLDWPEYSLQSLPLNHKNKKITVFSTSNSNLSKVDLQYFSYMKFTKFSYYTSLQSIPDLSSVHYLQSLDVEECINLPEVDSSFGSLKKLVYLNFLHCHKLHTFALYRRSENLQDLILKGCLNLWKFPEIEVEMKLVIQLCLNETAINELLESIEKLMELKDWYLENCRNLECLSSGIYKLKALQRVCVGGCLELQEFPKHKENLAFLELIYLGLQGCGRQEIGFIEKLSCHSSLKSLDLSKSKIVTIPAGLSKFSVLQQLNLTECEQLQYIWVLPPNVKYLPAKGWGSLGQCMPLSDSDILKPGNKATPCIGWMEFASCDKLTEHLGAMVDVLSIMGWGVKIQNGYDQLKVLFEVSTSTLKSYAMHLVLNKDRQANESPKPMYSQTSMMTSECRSFPTSLDRALWFASGCMASLFFFLVFSLFWSWEQGRHSNWIPPPT